MISNFDIYRNESVIILFKILTIIVLKSLTIFRLQWIRKGVYNFNFLLD